MHAEILLAPLRRGSDHAVGSFIDTIGATIVPVDRVIARRAARLRGAHSALRLPDAISLATAVVAAAEYVTLDRRLREVADAAVEDVAGR